MMDERLRDLYARGLAARAVRGATPDVVSVTPDDLLALAEGTLPEERRLELFDVVMASEPLRREFALVRAAVVAARQGGPAASSDADDGDAGGDTAGAGGAGVVTPRPAAPPAVATDVIPLHASHATPRARTVPAPWWRRVMGPMAIAASLLLVVMALGRRFEAGAGDPGDAGVMRGAADGIALAAPAIEAAPADARRFAWHPVPEAVRYAFELVDAGGALVYQTTTADTTVVLPATVPLRPAVEYRWLVRASDAAAMPRATAVRVLRIREP